MESQRSMKILENKVEHTVSVNQNNNEGGSNINTIQQDTIIY